MTENIDDEADILTSDDQTAVAESAALLPKKKMTPLPWKTMFTLSIVILAEPMSFTVIFPFIYYMVKSFQITDDDKNIGMYAGFIASSFSLAQFLTSLGWGYLSDRVGRRPILLIGLLGNFVSCVLFGFSKTLVWAIVSRSMCGLLNGNIGIAKCILGEITDETNQATAYSLFGLVFDIGLLLGPLIGGLLADPVTQYPSLFESSVLLKEYPYLLPCLVSSIFGLVGFVVGCFGLEETLKKKRTNLDEEKSEGQDLEVVKPKANFEIPIIAKFCILCYSLLAFAAVLNEELYPLWVAANPNFGGLGFLTPDIGISLTFMGAVGMPAQILVYPILQKKYGAVFGFTSVMIMITNSSSLSQLGIVHGISQTSASFVRAVGPAMSGNIWAWSLRAQLPFPLDYHFTFFILSFISAMAFILTFKITRKEVEFSR